MFLSKLWKKLNTNFIQRKFIRDVGVLTIANLVGAVLSFAQGILVARWLGPQLYGVAALVMSYPGLVFTFFDTRSSEASVKYLSEFHTQGNREGALAICKLGYIIDFAIGFIAFLVILLTANWSAREIVHRPEVSGLIVIYAAVFIPRGLIGTSRAVLTSLGKFSWIAWIDALTTFLRVGLILGLVYAGWKVEGVVWGNAIAIIATSLVYGVIGWVQIRKIWGAFPYRGKWQTIKEQRRGIFSFLAYNNFSTLLAMLPKQMDVLLLGYFRNPTEVGYYNLAKRLATIVNYIVSPLQSVTYPELSRLWGSGRKYALRKKARDLALKIGLPLGLVVLFFTLFLPIIIPAFLGEEYRSSITATQFLFIGYVAWLIFFWLRPLYLTIDKIKHWSVGISIYSLIFTILSIPVILEYGYLGISILQGISVTIFHIMMYVKILFLSQKYR